MLFHCFMVLYPQKTICCGKVIFTGSTAGIPNSEWNLKNKSSNFSLEVKMVERSMNFNAFLCKKKSMPPQSLNYSAFSNQKMLHYVVREGKRTYHKYCAKENSRKKGQKHRILRVYCAAGLEHINKSSGIGSGTSRKWQG